MAEVLTAIEVALCVSSVVKTLYEYVGSVKEAKDDIHRLTQELFTLKGALEHFDVHSSSQIDDAVQSQVQGMLRMTQDTLDTLQGRLTKHKSRFGRVLERLTWPLKSDEVQKHFDSIERSKTWFIMVILKDATNTTIAVYDEMKKLSAIINEDILERQTTKMNQETEELLKWLAPWNTEEYLALVARSKIPGTGQWFLNSESTAWLNSVEVEHPFLWITGKTGAGKTILFSTIVDELQTLSSSSKKSMVGFHCCSLNNAASQPLSNIFGSILAQICRERPDFLQHVEDYSHASSTLIPQNNLTFGQIQGIFKSILESIECLYILVDALNETPFQEQVVEGLISLCSRHPQIRVLVTCTRGPPTKYAQIRERDMPVNDVRYDIELYVNHRLHVEPSLRGLNPKIQAEIRQVMALKSEGMFRWAKLCMDRLAALRTGRDVRDALADMPTTLNETYVAILERIPKHDRAIAREALSWLCLSLRPLTLAELAEAVVLRESDVDIDDDSRLTDPAALLDICQGLAASNNDLVTLAHDSIRSFLLSPHIQNTSVAFFALNAAESHSLIMRKCLTYLQLSEFASGPVTSYEDLEERHNTYPLADYVTNNWPIHSEQFSLSKYDEERILEFFATKNRYNGSSFESWVQFLLNTISMEPMRQTEPLYYAASFNMTSILKLLLRPELKIDINRPGGRFHTPPLYIALYRHNMEAALMLLSAGADPDRHDNGSGETCRQLAFMQQNTEILRLMDELSQPAFPLRLRNYAIEEGDGW